MAKTKNTNNKRFTQRKDFSSKGFTLIETIIAVAIGAIIFGGIATLCTSTIKNGKFVEKLSDTNVLLSQKLSDLFNNASVESAKIPNNVLRVGSINPSSPVNGYFDLLNESGCLISNPITSPVLEPPIKAGARFGTGKLGDLGSDTGDSPTQSALNCSTSTFTTTSQSLIPKFRRQWVIAKDFPGVGDMTFSVVIVAIQTNQIVTASTITKSDGVSIK